MDYRELLRNEYLRRNQKNSAYSLRAFARDLGISPAFLTQLLSKKRRLDEAKAFAIAKRLKWPEWQCKVFIKMLALQKDLAKDHRQSLSEDIQAILGKHRKVFILKREVIQKILSWSHFAVMELTAITNFKLTSKSAAKKLGLAERECEEIIDRLRVTGFLEEREGRLIKTHSNYITGEHENPEAILKTQAEFLARSSVALKNIHHNRREFSSTLLASTPEKITEARQRLRNFRDELIAFLESGERTALYQFSLQLFPAEKE